MNSRRGGRLAVTAAVTVALALPAASVAAEESGHGGGGRPTDNTGTVYADLVVAYRAADGTPVLKEYFTEATEQEEASSHFCVQPAAFDPVPGIPAQTDPVTGGDVYVLPLQGEWLLDPPDPLPVEEIEPCDVQPQYAMFVSEVELERLNLGRTSEDVLQRKLDDVEAKLVLGDQVSLDAAGRITVDGAALDASPEYAAMYASLMRTGTVPGLDEDTSGQSVVSQAAYGVPSFSYGPYELAAVALGTAAGKSVPITVDTVQYYNRTVGFTEENPTWGVEFVQSADPVGDPDVTMPRDVLPGKEKFVDYGSFAYQRAATFPGSVTWLDVPTLTWQVSPILDVVDFTEVAEPGVGTTAASLTGLAGFAQMADDVRAVISYLHENEVIPGFVMDPVGVDTTEQQVQRLTSPATDLVLPDGPVFETEPFDLSASLFNPTLGSSIDQARLRVTITPVVGSSPLQAASVTASDGQSVPFTYDETSQSLIGWWGPAEGFEVPAGYRVRTAFTATLPDGAAGSYQVLLELVASGGTGEVLASDTETLTVLDDLTTVMWAGDVPEVATQGAQVPLPLAVYAPTGATAVQLGLAVSMDDPQTPQTPDPLTAGTVRVYVETADAMVAMPLTATAEGTLTGASDVLVSAGLTPVTWYLSVAEGAPVGQYSVDVSLAEGSDEAGTVTIGVSAPVDHTSPQPPVVEVTDVTADSATLVASSPDKDVDHYEFVLVRDFTHLSEITSVDGSLTYTDLDPGTYKVKVTAVDHSGNRSGSVDVLFAIADAGGGGGAVTPPPGPADDPAAPAPDPAEPGGQASPPDTFVGTGPANRSFVLGQSVTYRLHSTGEDAVYRVVLNNRFRQLCETSLCVVDGLRTGKNVLRFAARAEGLRDATPVVRTVYVPRAAAALATTRGWTVRENAGAFDGVLVRTRRQGQVVRTWARDLKRIALVVSKGAGNGRVEVYLGQRLLTRAPITLAARENRHQVLVPVTTFSNPQTGLVRVKVVSQGRPVRIEGIGILRR